MPSCEGCDVPDMRIRSGDEPRFVSRHGCLKEFAALRRNDRRIENASSSLTTSRHVSS
jgi:hypothetical protein